MAEDTQCRFCGLALADDDDQFHPDCVDAAHDDDDRPQSSDAHPLYGPVPGPITST